MPSKRADRFELIVDTFGAFNLVESGKSFSALYELGMKYTGRVRWIYDNHYASRYEFLENEWAFFNEPTSSQKDYSR